MLVMESGNCENCGADLGWTTMQQANVTCKRCGYSFKSCDRCKRSGCPKCKGKLLNVSEYIENEEGGKVLF